MATDGIPIDENLYSRQLYVLGTLVLAERRPSCAEAMKKMAGSNVFIAGQGGLGVEIAKNVALAGVKSLTIQDSKRCSFLDLSSQFFLGEQDIGKNRAEISGPRLNELNPYCPVHIVTDALESLPMSFFDQFAVVCLSDSTLSLSAKINDYCRSKGIKFITSDALGILGSVFVDVGTDFEIFDTNGEELLECIIGNVSNAVEGIVSVLSGTRHGLTTDDFVTFSEVAGMKELNGTTHRVKFVDAQTFKIGDTSKLGQYSKGGVGKQVRPVEKVSHKSLSASLVDPDVNIVDFSRMEAPMQLLLGLKALSKYRESHGGALPGVWSQDDAAKFLEVVKAENSSFKFPLGELDIALLTCVAFTSQGSLAGVTAFLGGMVAQEILKAVSGKFTPLKQWLLFDVSEVVPAIDSFDASDFLPRGDRSDAQRIVLGQKTCDLLANGRLFMIGCGAIGCELLKNFALMGFGTSGTGLISCTDNDLIEKSNLNRQFLFRTRDIGQPKSVSAGKAAKAMNPALRVDARTDKVSTDSENIFTDAFFQTQSLVVNALDNVEARMYVDRRCVDNGKALMESGTMGTKGHVQNILPELTANYSMTQDPQEGGIPFCTLKSFPYKSEHTIQWARDKFQSEFTLKPTETNQFLADSKKEGYWDKFRAAKPSKPDVSKSIRLLSILPRSFADCVQIALNKFNSFYRNQILQLLFNYPEDSKDKDGKPFWVAPRRMPRPLIFDANNNEHLSFVFHCAHLYANIFQVKDAVGDFDGVRKLAKEAKSKEYVIKTDKHIESDESAKKEEAIAKKREKESYSGNQFEEMLAEVQRLAAAERKPATPEDFEKDVDSNHHIDFITAAANLRNVQYGLELSDRLKTKKIAGRIIPAMATSTSAVSGLVSIEMIKVMLGVKDLTKYKNAWVNLALPAILFSEPQPCPVTKIHEELSVTLWTKRWEVRKGNLALGQLLNHFKKDYKLNVTGIFHNVSMIYAEFLADHKKRIPVKMSKLLGLADTDTREFVDLTCSFERLDGSDVKGPTVRYFLH